MWCCELRSALQESEHTKGCHIQNIQGAWEENCGAEEEENSSSLAVCVRLTQGPRERD